MRAHVSIGSCGHSHGCAQEALWVNFLIVYVCGPVVGKLTSSVVGGTDSVYWLHSSSVVGG